MFLLAAEGGHHTPLIVEFINHYFGEPMYRFQIANTKPKWDAFFGLFGTNAENMFGPYTPETAIPCYTIMFVIACILSFIVIKLLIGKLSEDDPSHSQLTVEAGFLALKNLIISVIGEHGYKYFPVVATFAVLVLVSNLMGTFPLFMSPTASVNVTFALGLASFIYYNYVGIKENGVLKHLGHLAGPRLPLMLIPITVLIFGIELVSNMIRPLTLGIRLFANMFADEQIYLNITNLFPPFTQIIVPALLLVMAVFVAFVQTLVFTLLSMIYISEVSHPPHDEHHSSHTPESGEQHAAPAAA